MKSGKSARKILKQTRKVRGQKARNSRGQIQENGWEKQEKQMEKGRRKSKRENKYKGNLRVKGKTFNEEGKKQ